MFKKPETRKRRSFLPFVIFRLCLSLTMFLILGLGAYEAFRYFSGSTTDDLLKTDPKTLIISVLSSEDAAKTISNFLGFSLPKPKLPGQVAEKPQPVNPEVTPAVLGDKSKLVMKMALVADSHLSNDNLKKALLMAKDKGAKFVIGLGDYSDTGTVAELKKAKAVFDASQLPYYVTAGDHDLWDARDKGLTSSSNFNQVFGSAYQSFVDSRIRFVIVFNSDNYEGLDGVQMKWLEDTLTKADSEKFKQTFVFLHEPLYHPSSDHMMGKVTPKLTEQAAEMEDLFKKSAVAEIFAGDTHAFARYEDPKNKLKMTIVGALTEDRNTQKPRFAMVDIFDDGSYNIQDLEIESK